MTFDPKSLLNIDPDVTRALLHEKVVTDAADRLSKRSPSARLMPPVKLNQMPPQPVSAVLAVKRLMSDDFTKAACDAGLRATNTAQFVQMLRDFLILGKMPKC